ncbi:hypothetical protein PYW07_010369 [Mythimna separata]|uniref:C-type lectin domain-containing protein n=1 Tax=Mythimna separata TaxID=271217 RepID=A0AAD7YA87_MYTSE|nr:hypothetical protein PYW07_010369 [Mythimna separata]
MLKYLFCATLLFVTDVVVCKPDYLFNHEVNGWLKLHVVPATWQDAFFNCHYAGAMLASPINAKLATALSNIMSASNLDAPIYLGVNDVSGGDFISDEGVPLADLSITWGTYVNDGKQPHCLSFYTNGKTYLSSCTEFRPYICYKKRDNTTILNQCGTFDDDYHLYHATGSCYKYHKKHTSWVTAQKTCVAEGGHLVIINDKQEADIVTSFLHKSTNKMSWPDAAYVGLLDRGKDHRFFTLHGEAIQKVYHTWAPGQPDNKGINLCGLIYPEGTLDDVDCNKALLKFICEKNPNTSRFENVSGEVSDASENSCCDETCCK